MLGGNSAHCSPGHKPWVVGWEQGKGAEGKDFKREDGRVPQVSVWEKWGLAIYTPTGSVLVASNCRSTY